MLKRCAVLLSIFFAAVSSALAGAPAAIDLSPASSDEWRVVYTAAEPVEAMSLWRAPDGSRAASWTPDDAAIELVHKDGSDIIRRKDGAAFRKVGFVMKARYVSLPKDYAPFSPFTDGGLLIYSGRFHACAGVGDCVAPAPDSALEWRVSVTPPKGARSIVHGKLHKGKTSFVDNDSGTNIYVGRTKPVESSHVIGVIDEAFPADARDALMNLLPKLLDLFTEKFGPLDAKPMLFASLDPYPPEGSGFNSQGGTLPNQIFIHLYGEKWAEGAGEKLKGRLPWFFAHEAAHLFQRTRESGDWNMDQSWIHEGGADALAALAVTDLEAVSPDYVQTRIGEALGVCASGLKKLSGKPLNASAEQGAFENYYACGLLMQLAIDAETKAASAGEKSLYDVWALFLDRVLSGAEWEQEVFLGAASDLGATGAADFAREIANEPLADPAAFLRAGLEKAGVATPKPKD